MSTSKLPLHETTPGKIASLEQIRQAIPGVSAAAQRQRIREALQVSACTSVELIRYLDCYDANARIHELRHREGAGIAMSWVQQETEVGELHRVGLFYLDTEVSHAAS